MTTDNASFVGSMPENYDRGLGPYLFVDYAADLAQRAAAVEPRRVLELAAGTGIVTRSLRDALPGNCELTATDLNPPMLDVATAKFQAGENVKFEPADATALEYADTSFDTAVCQFGIMFFPDKDQSFKEVRRVLQPGGTYLFNVWDAWEHNAYARIVFETVSTYFDGDPPGFFRVPFSYHDVDVIEPALRAAGFTQIRSAHVKKQVRLSSASDFAQGLVYGNPSQVQLLERGVDPDEVRDAVALAIDEQLGNEMTIQALVVEAVARS